MSLRCLAIAVFVCLFVASTGFADTCQPTYHCIYHQDEDPECTITGYTCSPEYGNAFTSEPDVSLYAVGDKFWLNRYLTYPIGALVTTHWYAYHANDPAANTAPACCPYGPYTVSSSHTLIAPACTYTTCLYSAYFFLDGSYILRTICHCYETLDVTYCEKHSVCLNGAMTCAATGQESVEPPCP